MAEKNIGLGNAAGLLEYLDTIIDKGRATSGAIIPLKTAFRQVMEQVDGKDWQQKQVTEIDVDDYLARFGNLTRGRYSDQSLVTYKSRVKKVVEWYLKFMDQPGWMPSVERRAPRGASKNRTAASKNQGSSVTASAGGSANANDPNDIHAAAAEGFTTYPFPLSGGQMATLKLPVALQEADAKRLERFIDSLVVKGPQKLLGKGYKDEEGSS